MTGAGAVSGSCAAGGTSGVTAGMPIAGMPIAGRGHDDGGGIALASALALPQCDRVATCAMVEGIGVRIELLFAYVRVGNEPVDKRSSPPPHRFSVPCCPSECQSGELRGTEPRRMAGTPPGVVSREAEERDLMGCCPPGVAMRRGASCTCPRALPPSHKGSDASLLRGRMTRHALDTSHLSLQFMDERSARVVDSSAAALGQWHPVQRSWQQPSTAEWTSSPSCSRRMIQHS